MSVFLYDGKTVPLEVQLRHRTARRLEQAVDQACKLGRELDVEQVVNLALEELLDDFENRLVREMREKA